MSTTAKGLRSLGLQSRYRSPEQDVVQSFFVPSFEVATSYSRAVGFFTAASLALFARGIDVFAKRGGVMRLVASPRLDEDDIDDIYRGYEIREVMQRATLRELTAEHDDRIRDGLGVVGRLIAAGTLDIKLAFVEKGGRVGMYHEKIGVFRDDVGELVSFNGSNNETYNGLMANFESFVVYKGWEPGVGALALQIESDFDKLWSNETQTLSVIPFPDVARECLEAVRRERPNAVVPATDVALEPEDHSLESPKQLMLPDWLQVRDYQRQAVESWLQNGGRGLFKMATGTGKTKTAMIAATQLGNALRDREEPLVVVIVAPLKHLVDQWLREVEDFGAHAIPIYESSKRWQARAESQLMALRLGQRSLVVMVATKDSFGGERFQRVLSSITEPLLVVADEAHNLGSSKYLTTLPANATYRLALSATPERWFDADGTDALIGYFDKVVFELPMAEAIAMGALTRYHYFPRLVELTSDESEYYAALTARIAQIMSSGEDLKDPDPDSPLGRLLRERSNILGHAENKIPALEQDLRRHRGDWYQLVYCGEGYRPAPPGEPQGPRQLADVMDLIGNEMHLSVHDYIGETPRSKRKELLKRFSSGDDLRLLAAMKCLDEGVDIPDARIGYLLASSTNPRQFIQRRGRLLRRAAGKDHATIYDYLAVPPGGVPVNFNVERNLVIRELQRVNEFGLLSENYEESLEALRPLKERYQLMDM